MNRIEINLPANYVRILKRGVPLIIAATLICVKAFSQVDLSGGILPENLFTISLATYIICLIKAAVLPSKRIHLIAGTLGSLVFITRGMAFLQIVLDGSRFDLIGAVTERSLLAILVFIYHWMMIPIADK